MEKQVNNLIDQLMLRDVRHEERITTLPWHLYDYLKGAVWPGALVPVWWLLGLGRDLLVLQQSS